MSSSPAKLVIATRQSALAMWQAGHVRDRLRALHPSCIVELLGVTTEGDRVLDIPLSAIGGKGLFIKELELAMLERRADLAVHSLKDVPMVVPEGFTLAAIMAREDPRDAFVANAHKTLAGLPPGSIVGTSSVRREAQLRERFPHLGVKSLRGNVDTRLRKLDEGHYAAIILAAAGLNRLGFAGRIAELLDPADSLPAIGQGALAIECRTSREDVIDALRPLADSRTMFATAAERAFGTKLGGDCRTPLAAYATARGDELWLRAFVASRDGGEVLRGERAARVTSVDMASALGHELAGDFLARGAARVLAQ